MTNQMTLRPMDPANYSDVQDLYRLLVERPDYARISSVERPEFADHVAFIHRHPYRVWYMIDVEMDGVTVTVGSIYATTQNEIGIAIQKAFHGMGFGPRAIDMLISTHRPLPALPGTRPAQWLANINPANERSIKMFERMGFKLIQQTYALPPPERRET